MKAFILALGLSLLAGCGQTQTKPAESPAQGIRAENPNLHIENAWAAPSPGGVDVAAGYLTIVNGANLDDQLLRAESPRADHVDIHEMAMQGAVMQMRAINALLVPAHDQVTLSPNGRHLMFNGVKQPFRLGEHIPVDLTFAHAGKLHLTLDVRVPS